MKERLNVMYLRTSTEDQHPEDQLAECKTLINEPFKLFQVKESAWDDSKPRPEFEEIILMIKSGKVKILIVWDIDRIFRNRKRLKGFFEMCKSYNCQIYSFRQKWLTELQNLKLPEGFEWIGEMQINNFIQFLGWIAEEESSKKSDRVRKAFQNHKGKKWGRPKIHTNKKKIIWGLRKEGKSLRVISEITKLSLGAVSGVCSEMHPPQIVQKTPHKKEVQ